MKLLKPLCFTFFSCIYAYSQTTMCFKENHNSMATIESTKLAGGECNNLFSLNEMKKKGWSVEDIKITTKNDKYSFIYILKKASNISSNSFTSTNSSTNSNLSEKELEEKIIKRLEAKKEQEKKEKELEEKIIAKKRGQELYTKKCQSCHGTKGEKSVHAKAKLLKDMKLEDIKFAISRYTNDIKYGYGKQILMRPYAQNSNNRELEAIHTYLQNLN